MRHVQTLFALSSTHAECINSVADILLSVDVPVLLPVVNSVDSKFRLFGKSFVHIYISSDISCRL